MFEHEINAIMAQIDSCSQRGGRVLVAIAGAPGSGKSTISDRLVAAIRARDGENSAALIPMDGFHLDNSKLDALGLRAVKGAPQTFDVAGFVSLVRKVKSDNCALRYPLFDRALDKALPEAEELHPEARVVVFEGNYLLLQEPEWADLADLFDVTVMLSVPLAELRARLVDRWLTYGLSRPDAEARADGNDIVNARLVIGNSAPAHLTLGADRSMEILER